MYEIIIRDLDEQEVLTHVTTNAFMLTALQENAGNPDTGADDRGVVCSSAAHEASAYDMLKLILGFDTLKEKYIKDHPLLRLAYAMKDDIVDSMTSIDVSALKHYFGDNRKEDE